MSLCAAKVSLWSSSLSWPPETLLHPTCISQSSICHEITPSSVGCDEPSGGFLHPYATSNISKLPIPRKLYFHGLINNGTYCFKLALWFRGAQSIIFLSTKLEKYGENPLKLFVKVWISSYSRRLVRGLRRSAKTVTEKIREEHANLSSITGEPWFLFYHFSLRAGGKRKKKRKKGNLSSPSFFPHEEPSRRLCLFWSRLSKLLPSYFGCLACLSKRHFCLTLCPIQTRATELEARAEFIPSPWFYRVYRTSKNVSLR